MTRLMAKLCLVSFIWQLSLVETTIFNTIPTEGQKAFHSHSAKDPVIRHLSPSVDETLVLNTRGKFAHSGIRKQRNAALEQIKMFRVRRKSQAGDNAPRFIQNFNSARPVPLLDHMEAPKDTFDTFSDNRNGRDTVNDGRRGRNQFASSNNFAPFNQVTAFVPQSERNVFTNSLPRENFQNAPTVFNQQGIDNQISNNQRETFSNNNQAFSPQQGNTQGFSRPIDPARTNGQPNQAFNQNQNSNSNRFNQNSNSNQFNQNSNSNRFNQNSNSNQFNQNSNSNRFNQNLNSNRFNQNQNSDPQTLNQNVKPQNLNQNTRNTNPRFTQQQTTTESNTQVNREPKIQGFTQQQNNVRNTNTFVTPQQTKSESSNQVTLQPKIQGNTNPSPSPPTISKISRISRDQISSGNQNTISKEERQGREGGYSAPDYDDGSGDDGYTAPDPQYGAPVAEYGASSEPIAILKMTGLDSGPLPTFNYMFKTANDINVMAEGELRNVCDEDVSVMKGSYDYVGPDGNTYKVDWYADETGFHPTLDHLPQPVKPDHPEVAAAVAAQLAFAASEGYGAPAADDPCPPKGDYGAPLPSYDSLPDYSKKV